ncbi:MarR family transcriptional regulator [Actinacidiphila sp. DG2A-62]|uniref:MarR family winged helix-turn-helix transcriptional regulator n=1 Tax=Actinacidiphila sp. DG2A-62 TaxID=3108821 RepID=UPI002DB69D29|nr:MarR family transcriptional regulator [Actinacidiphila sp. DG2A-62]MEC3997326.1 MarR family transcriptional regulator [Actinacidiphila sp. DG2A-62]
MSGETVEAARDAVGHRGVRTGADGVPAADAVPAAPGVDGVDGVDGADEERFVDALATSAFVVMGTLTRIGAEHDLSLTQMRVLGILRDRRPRMAELADHLGLEKSTMSGLVARAERRGLLARAKSPSDGRAIDVFLTDAGLDLATRVHDEVRRALTPLTGALDARDARTVTRLLERMLGDPF